MTDGDKLRYFIDNQHKSKISIAKDLGISKQTLFQYFKSSVLTNEVRSRFESYFSKEIFTGNTVVNMQKEKAATIANLINKNQVSNNSYQDEYIQSLKEQIALYKEKCDKLEKDTVNLNEMMSNQEALVVMVKEVLRRAANYRYASTDKKKLLEELDEINKIIGGVLK